MVITNEKLCYKAIVLRGLGKTLHISAPQSKNAVSTNIKHSVYIQSMSNFSTIDFHTKRLYVHMIDIADTPFSYGRELIVC